MSVSPECLRARWSTGCCGLAAVPAVSREARDLERKVPRMRLWFFPVSVPTALDFLALRLLFCVTPAFQNLADCQTVRGSGELSPGCGTREMGSVDVGELKFMLFSDLHPVFSL